MDTPASLLVLLTTLVPLILIALFIRVSRTAPRPLHDLVCVLTGGAGEIGQVVCRLLLEKGVIVVVWDINDVTMKQMTTTFASDRVHYFKVDVSSCEDVERATKEVVEQFGGVDVLINNAAVANPFDLEESTPEELQTAINVNLLSHFWTIRALLPHLRKSKMYNGLKGSIIGISSVLGGVGTGGLQTYCSSKAGVIGLMESLYMQHTDLHWCIVTPFLVNTLLFRGMGHKYMDYIYPILDKTEVADKIVRSIEYQQSYVTIPWFWNYAFILCKNLFPLSVMRQVEELFGVRVAYRQINRRSSRSTPDTPLL